MLKATLVLVAVAVGLLAALPAARMTTAGAPPSVEMSLDCNPTLAGVQSSCMVSNMATTRDVNIVIRNSGSVAFELGAWGFKALNPDITRLKARIPGVDLPACNSGTLTDCNPDFNQAAVTGGGWACGPPGAFPDDPITQEPGEDATLACFNGFGDTAGPILAAGSSLNVATVRYNIVAGADPGPLPITLYEGGIYDEGFDEQGSCAPVFAFSMPCNSVTLTFYCPIDLADVNNDNIVNVADVGITSLHNGQQPAPAQYDQNFDGVINVADRGLVAVRYSKRPSVDCP